MSNKNNESKKYLLRIPIKSQKMSLSHRSQRCCSKQKNKQNTLSKTVTRKHHKEVLFFCSSCYLHEGAVRNEQFNITRDKILISLEKCWNLRVCFKCCHVLTSVVSLLFDIGHGTSDNVCRLPDDEESLRRNIAFFVANWCKCGELQIQNDIGATFWSGI